MKIILLVSEEKVEVAQQMHLKSEILEIGEQCFALPLLDSRTVNEVLGYDTIGLPT